MLPVLFSVLLIASDTAAAAPETPPAPATKEAAAEAPKKICKRELVTGQLQGTKKVCMTAEQWKAVRESRVRAKR